ncbi:MAG: hypothetical protein DLM55_04875 [Acidimicrobiales bacterium]|nr:MAG: hypothetical protein DLM55_04875 [Acidimicrobiales bacterium]
MEIKWDTKGIWHLATRDQRYGPRATNFVAMWANEAASDPHATMLPIDPAAPYRRVVTGYSSGYGGYMTVIYLEIGDHRHGVTAYPTGEPT